VPMDLPGAKPNLLAAFAAAVRKAECLPEGVRAVADQAVNVQISTFDQSYLLFLGQQIELAPRGPEWTERLKRRLAGLSGFCDRPLIDGRIAVDGSDYWIKVDPQSETLVYWEDYRDIGRP
jgi:hypothetical protein